MIQHREPYRWRAWRREELSTVGYWYEKDGVVILDDETTVETMADSMVKSTVETEDEWENEANSADVAELAVEADAEAGAGAETEVETELETELEAEAATEAGAESEMTAVKPDAKTEITAETDARTDEAEPDTKELEAGDLVKPDAVDLSLIPDYEEVMELERSSAVRLEICIREKAGYYVKNAWVEMMANGFGGVRIFKRAVSDLRKAPRHALCVVCEDASNTDIPQAATPHPKPQAYAPASHAAVKKTHLKGCARRSPWTPALVSAA